VRPWGGGGGGPRGRDSHPTSQPKDPDFRGKKVKAMKRWACAMVSYMY